MIDWQQIDTLFLDMDGTLLDLHFDNYFWQKYLPSEYAKHHNLEPDQARQYIYKTMADVQGSIDWYCVDFWTKKLGVDIVSLKKEIDHLIALRPAVVEFLEAMHRSAKKVYLITNAHHDALELKLEKINISHYFDELISSHQYGYIKEQQEFWLQLRKNIDFDPQRTLFIDDSQVVLDAAAKYGIGHILSISTPDSKEQARPVGNYPMLNSFSDIMYGISPIHSKSAE